jgi:hypothetical protein
MAHGRGGLGVRCGHGGPAVYFGQAVLKPHLGPDGQWNVQILHLLLRIVSLAGALLTIVGVIVLAVHKGCGRFCRVIAAFSATAFGSIGSGHADCIRIRKMG